MPVFRIEIVSADEICVYCGPHYRAAVASGAVSVTVRRIDGKWRATSLIEEVPNPERVIVT
jgi:hypothetical protein